MITIKYIIVPIIMATTMVVSANARNEAPKQAQVLRYWALKGADEKVHRKVMVFRIPISEDLKWNDQKVSKHEIDSLFEQHDAPPPPTLYEIWSARPVWLQAGDVRVKSVGGRVARYIYDLESYDREKLKEFLEKYAWDITDEKEGSFSLSPLAGAPLISDEKERKIGILRLARDKPRLGLLRPEENEVFKDLDEGKKKLNTMLKNMPTNELRDWAQSLLPSAHSGNMFEEKLPVHLVPANYFDVTIILPASANLAGQEVKLYDLYNNKKRLRWRASIPKDGPTVMPFGASFDSIEPPETNGGKLVARIRFSMLANTDKFKDVNVQRSLPGIEWDDIEIKLGGDVHIIERFRGFETITKEDQNDVEKGPEYIIRAVINRKVDTDRQVYIRFKGEETWIPCRPIEEVRGDPADETEAPGSKENKNNDAQQ